MRPQATRREQLLRLLLERKAGLTVEELAGRLHISRNAVRQHLTSLEAEGLVTKGATQATGGRPEQLYVLSTAGNESFPRKYSWFSELLLDSLRTEKGEDALIARFERLGNQVGTQMQAARRLPENPTERVKHLAAVMQELGYEAESTEPSGRQLPMIEATNCVFHQLAARFPEICHFDLALLSTFVGRPVVHDECIVRGGHVCRFKFKPS
ncbi:MAG TPA: HTH domain-containing protein [Nitrospiraceae bacterium]|nr:HTH domain-containing protein [Nitrospiraceae bacterium]